MNNNYDPLEDTTYDDLEEDPYSHSPQEGEFSEDFPSKLRRSATGAQNADDEMTDGPVDENSKEGEVESFLSILLLFLSPSVASHGLNARINWQPCSFSLPFTGFLPPLPLSDVLGALRYYGFGIDFWIIPTATSIAIIEDMRTGTPLYDMTPTQVREEQRRQLRAQYTCSERWLQVVERCHPYELPSPEDCSEHAPEEMKALIHVPNRARARGNATLSHFFRSVKVFDEGEEKSKYLCAIMTDDSCKIKLSGGAGMIGRESHMNSIHKAVYEAFRLFQGLQNCLGRLPVDPHASQEQQEYQAPSTPKRTPRKTKFQGALPGIPIPTLEDKATVEACWLNLLSEGAVNYSLFDNPNFRKIKALTDGDNPPRHGPN
ncbi:MAG: hypothetical protein J3R72DRAFT_472187 [Linnemannia gamsii]|nr:MAG: hypothetical protein J3R72DRAFT_472187 [Linnemannia gamsii]